MKMRPFGFCLVCLAALCAVPGCAARERDIGLVLSGGGCKGAYHLGVWRALEDAGLAGRVGVISGTSVGALCSALLASVDDRYGQERVWQDTFEIIGFKPDRADVERIYLREAERNRKWYGVEDLSPELEKRLWETAEAQARHELMPKVARAYRELEANPDTTNLVFGAMSMESLRRNLDAMLPDPFPADGPSVYAAALKCGGEREIRYFRINALDRKTQIDALCASAAIPIAFPPVEIDDALWQDGGWEDRGGDNTPIVPILQNHKDVKTIIVVYLQDDKSFPPGYRRALRLKAHAAGVRLIEIVPSRNIGGPLNGWFGVFDTSQETMHELIETGYSDAKKALLSF